MAFLESECFFRKPLQLRRIEPHRSSLFHLAHQFIGDFVQRENFFLSYTKQIVVVCPALNDRFRRPFHAGRVIDEHRWISRPGANRSVLVDDTACMRSEETTSEL